MAIDAGIFANQLRAAPTVQDFDAANQAFQQNALKLQGDRQTLADQNALRQATMQFGDDPSQNVQLLRRQGLFGPAQSLQASGFSNAHLQAQTNQENTAASKNIAAAGEQSALGELHQTQQKIDATNFHLQQLQGITDPSQIPGWVADGVKSGVQDFSSSQQGLQQFMQAVQTKGLDAAKQQALQGGQSVAESLKQQQVAQLAQLSQQGENSRNAATNQTHLQAANIAAATSRANNEATIGKDYKVAGIDPQTGNFVGAAGDGSPGGMQGMVDALGQYKMDPSQVFSRMQPGVRAQVIAQVQQKYPDYDPTTFAAKKSAATAFTTGTQGNSLRSFAVAGQHLDQLGTLVDALGNGNTQIINQIGNQIGQQFGTTAVTNFDAAKDIVGKEVVKAIVAGGGGVAEREELSKQLSSAKSPAQLKGVIQQYQGLMGAQHDALLNQRRAAGLPDSTLPHYTGSGSGAPPASNPLSVATPDGQVHSFPTAAAAAQFRQAAGL